MVAISIFKQEKMIMQVKELLDKKGHDVYSISPDATVYDALKLMAEKEIGALVVLEDGKMVLKGKASKDTTVREIMTTEVIHISSDAKVGKCLSLMGKHNFRHIPVLEEERLVGILSIEDVKGVT
jgi:CBS domain-containing protein